MGIVSKELEERLLPSSQNSDLEYSYPRSKPVWKSKRLCLWTIINTLISGVLVTYVIIRPLLSKDDINATLKSCSFYSPVLDDIEISTFESQIDGGVAAGKKDSLARMPPGPEADKAWHRFEDIRTVVLSKDDIIGLGKDPTTAAKFPDEHWHFGTEAYMGQLDVFHQIHCLNQLRKRAFASYYEDNADRSTSQRDPEWKWVHLQHCVSILFDNLVCNANTDMLTLNWIEETDYPFPDFSVNKQCRDLEAVLKWRDDRAVDRDQWMNMTKPADGIRVIKGEKEWWDLFDEEGKAIFGNHSAHS